jgi:hypothetical protein
MKDYTELFTPEKLARHAAEDAKPATKFLYSSHGVYHIGARRELRGARSNLISSVYYVAKCNGKRLGGSWGQIESTELPAYRVVRCKRCFGQEGGFR